jgi:hypothetical protein
MYNFVQKKSLPDVEFKQCQKECEVKIFEVVFHKYHLQTTAQAPQPMGSSISWNM